MPSLRAAGRADARRGPWLASGVSLLGLVAVLAGGALWTTQASGEAGRESAHARWAELTLLIHEVNGAAQDEMLALGRAALDNPHGDRPTDLPATRHRVAVAGAHLASLRTLMSDATVGPTAKWLLDTYEDLEEADADLDLYDLYDLGVEAVNVTESVVAGDPDLHSLVQLVDHAALPRLVVWDAQDVEFLQSGEAADWAGGYFDPNDDYITSGDAGWLGPAKQPLPSPYVDSEPLASTMSAAWTALGTAIASQDAVLAFDDWVVDWPDREGTGQPVPLAGVREQAAELSLAVDAIVGEAIVDARSGAESRAGAARTRQLVGLLVAGLLGLVATAFLIRSARRVRGHVESWRRAAITDRLTGLTNRHGLFEHAHGCADDACADHAVLLFDLDHFKQINDTYGHAVGDEALKLVAQHAREIADRLPGRALAARLGGDEFVVLLHDLRDAAHEADRAATALIAAVTGTPVVTESGTVPLSVSVGAATTVDLLDLDTLLLHADMALYEVKRAGRGAHRVHPAAPTHA